MQYLTTNSKVIFKEKQQYLLFAFLINNSKRKTHYIRLSSNRKLSTEDRLINSARIKEQRLKMIRDQEKDHDLVECSFKP